MSAYLLYSGDINGDYCWLMFILTYKLLGSAALTVAYSVKNSNLLVATPRVGAGLTSVWRALRWTEKTGSLDT